MPSTTTIWRLMLKEQGICPECKGKNGSRFLFCLSCRLAQAAFSKARRHGMASQSSIQPNVGAGTSKGCGAIR